jgi:alpha-1,3-rhamnosyl/mannosyltransferase
MKVILNVDSLVPPLTGIGTYIWHLVNGLHGHRMIDEVLAFSRNGTLVTQDTQHDGEADGPWPGGVSSRNLVPNSLRGWLRRLPRAYELRDRMAARLLQRTGAAQRGCIYHEPNYVAVPYDGPSVVTVSDLSHLHYPQYHPPARVRWLCNHLARSVGQAQEVICLSESMREEIINVLGVAPEKVNVVHPGASEAFRPRTAAELQPVLRRYGLDDARYLLTVGTVEPRKNLIGLIEAYNSLPQALRQAFPLVVVGTSGWLTKPIERAMRPLEQEGSLRRMGYVAVEDMPFVYAGAHAFAYLSFYEGFGLPVVEAMRSGIPVMTSDRSALPEVAGAAALLVNPEDNDAVAAGLRRLLEDETLRQHAAATGRVHSLTFSWETCVDQTVAVYEKALKANAVRSCRGVPGIGTSSSA